jgi:site-specific recombinase XerD
MEQARYTFNFCIKKSRLAFDGKAPIYLRVTIDMDRKEKATNLFVNPDEWESKFGLSIGKDKYSLSLNSRLTVIRTKMLEAYTALSSLGGVPSAEDVINKFLGKEPEKAVEMKHYLIPLFQEHNDRCEKLADNGQMAPGTVIRYKTSLNHTRDFIRYRYATEDIELNKIDLNFIDEYEFYLKTKPEQPCSHNTTMKYLRNFGKIIRIAVQRKLIADDPFEHKSLKLEEVYPEFLEEHELTTILNKNFKTDRLRQARDVFAFCCFTGLAFSDVKELSKTHICEDNDTISWIKKLRHKTQVMCSVPLLEQAVDILSKYKDKVKGGYLLPVLSNQKYNEYLKEIAEVCHIEKDISTHSARHTFATLALNNGVALQNVAKMLGHSNIKMTQRYARVLDRSVKRDMENLQSVISNLAMAQ